MQDTDRLLSEMTSNHFGVHVRYGVQGVTVPYTFCRCSTYVSDFIYKALPGEADVMIECRDMLWFKCAAMSARSDWDVYKSQVGFRTYLFLARERAVEQYFVGRCVSSWCFTPPEPHVPTESFISFSI